MDNQSSIHKSLRKVYVVRQMFLPNSAVINRMMGHLRAFSKAGMKVEAAFILPNRNGDKCEAAIEGVTFRYCWGDVVIKNRYLKILYSYRCARKYVKTIPAGSDVLLLGATDYFPFFMRRKDIKLYYETTEYPGLFRKGGRLQNYFKKCQQLKHIFVISRPLKQLFVENGIPEEKVTIVNMTVDPQRFDGVEKNPSVEKYIAYCGTISNNKDGVDGLLQAFALTHRSHPEVKLYIIGATPDVEDRAGNMRLIDELGVQSAVVFTGIVPASEMPQILKNAAVLTLDRPDNIQAKYGFPTKLGEYLLTGNPVVITKVGDIPLFLEDGKSALLCEDNDPTGFASKLIWALDNPTECIRIGECGKTVALQRFDCIKEGEKMLNIIGLD